MYKIPTSVRSKRGDFLIGKPLHPKFIFFFKYIINEREIILNFYHLSDKKMERCLKNMLADWHNDRKLYY